MDESGDLGFSGKSSRYFVIGYIIVEQGGRASVEIKRLLKTLNIKRRHPIKEFKFSNDNDFIRCKVLNLIGRLNIMSGQVVIKKTAVSPNLRDKKSILYNFIVAENIATAVLDSYEDLTHFNLHIDLSMSKSSRDHFDLYFSDKIDWKLSLSKNKQGIKSTVYHDHSHDEPCIQIADYIAGSLYQLYERGNVSYYDKIKGKIIHKREWT